MGLSIGHASKPPPPPLLPFRLPIRGIIASAGWAADDNSMSIITSGRPDEGELGEACVNHVIRPKKEYRRRPQDGVEQSVGGEKRPSKRKERYAQVFAHKRCNASND